MKIQPHVYDRVMNRWRCWSLVVCSLVTACTKANPAFSCSDTPCTDPNFPYCDIDGSVGGIPEACTAVTCTAGAFQSCRGDNIALTCNNSGTSFDEVQCAHGCDAATGCKLCEANQTVCQNGVVASCDANGVQTSTTQCPLGCFEDQPRCRDIDPSNHLGTYLDMNPTPPDLDLSTGDWYVLNDAAGTLSGPAGAMLIVPNYLVTQPAGGPKIHVYVVNNLKLGSVYFAGPNDVTQSQATAFLAAGDVTITGPITVSGLAGSYADTACSGKMGYSTFAQANGAIEGYGPGGGGAVAPGSTGGVVNDPNTGPPSAGGSAFGADNLEPLVGGCQGGGYHNYSTGEIDPFGAYGGGSIQISSRKSITIAGTMNADGGRGGGAGSGPGDTVTQGGGAGGSFLIEGPLVTIAANSTITAIGGDGFGCEPASEFCGARGKGGTASSAPTVGGSIAFVTAAGASAEFYAGGGGGSVGRIRINTPTSTYGADSSALLNASVTTGTIKTR